MAGFALARMDPRKNQTPKTKEARTGRASFAYSMEACSYARARQRLALLFARLLLLPASTKPRAEGAVRFRQLAATGCMGQLEQIDLALASAARISATRVNHFPGR
jgi:hypothetical protein